MKSIEIVTHCYCPEGQDTYAQHLKWQFASLIRYMPKNVKVKWTVFHAQEDRTTTSRLDKCWDLGSVQKTIQLNPQVLQLGRLFRRSIGRDEATKKTNSDIVWFTDVDYMFGDGCLDKVAELMDRRSSLCVPESYWISFDHEGDEEQDKKCHHRVGQKMVDDHREDDLPTIDTKLFSKINQRLAIGGLQIIGGDFARKHGYLRGIEEWQKPVDSMKGFLSCRCDSKWRRINGLHARRLPIPNVFRIRHLEDGRDYNLAGDKVGKKVWK